MRPVYIVMNILLLFILPVAAAAQDVIPGPQVGWLQDDGDLVRLRVSGTGLTHEDILRQAEDLAFKTILYRGLPGASARLTNPLIGTNESEIMANHAAYMRSFFQDRRLKSFIQAEVLSAGPVTYKNRSRTKKDDPIGLTYDLTINVNALRMDLEKNGIVRKFGF